MKKFLFLSSSAVVALAMFPGIASAQLGGSLTGEGTVTYNNELSTSLIHSVTYTKDVSLEGSVDLEGAIDVNASAVAVVDNKQAIVGNSLTFREENELNGENGFVDAEFGPGYSEGGDNAGTGSDGTLQGNIRVGFFAPIINETGDASVAGSGNVGVNVAAGWYNAQENVAAIAASTFVDTGDDEETGGWAEASVTALQFSSGNFYGAAEGEIEEDDPEAGGGGNNFRERNTAGLGTVGGDGNIGINSAAGAFNIQKNAMALATVTDSSLAEASAGIVQVSFGNDAEIQDSENRTGTFAIAGATGNIGVNVAAGVGNMQINSLSMAVASGDFSDGGTGTGVEPDDPS
jgi:hypothetical protein